VNGIIAKIIARKLPDEDYRRGQPDGSRFSHARLQRSLREVSLPIQLRKDFHEFLLRLLQPNQQPAMLVAVNRFLSLYARQKRVLSRIHFRFRGLDLFHVAHGFISRDLMIS
jgi:hypothetical protein